MNKIMESNCYNCELYNKCLTHSLALAYGKVLNASTDREILVKCFVDRHPEAHQTIMCENFNILESEADRAFSLLLNLDIAGMNMNGEDLIRIIYDSNKR